MLTEHGGRPGRRERREAKQGWRKHISRGDVKMKFEEEEENPE
jgi:hypothetical protein